MTDTELLEKTIRDSGLRREFIMKQTGIKAYATLRAKIRNESEFTASEIDKLCTVLSIAGDKRERIFFAHHAE